MYFRMLKRDLTDHVGLNITLFVFMILASALLIVSTHLLYTSFVGTERTYELCSTPDVTFITDSSVSDKEGRREAIKAACEENPHFDRMYVCEGIRCLGSMVEYENGAGETVALRPDDIMLAQAQAGPKNQYGLDGTLLAVPNGGVALPQHLLGKTEVGIGDTLYITTQMGNVYAFTVTDYYKDPTGYVFDCLLFSPADFAALAEESPLKQDIYEIYLSVTEGDYESAAIDAITDLANILADELNRLSGWANRYTTNDALMGLVVALALSLVAVFLIITIFMTIHFSLRAAIKQNEKEIGIMKAIGVDSLSYRALFAVKYVAFAVVGGIIGLPLAMPLGSWLMNLFMIHILLPSMSARIVMAVAAVLGMILVMVLFTLFSLRAMKKVSVMDAIHGEHRGERFRKLPGLLLHKKKVCGIALFLALNDILGKVKRYAYLILAYACGIFIVLLVVQLRDSICSFEYMHNYNMIVAMDYAMEIEPAYFNKLLEKEGSYEAVYASITETFAENGIPARVDYYSLQIVNTEFEGEQPVNPYILFGDFPHMQDVAYVEGGRAPELYNEVAIARRSAKLYGIDLGDVISIEYQRYGPDRISWETVTEEFVVTAYVDSLSLNQTIIMMSDEFTNALSMGCLPCQYRMNCPPEEYQYYYDKMDALFTDEEIRFWPKEEALMQDGFIRDFYNMFTMMIRVASTVVAVVLTLITVLYESIFLEEEVSDIAVMKSLGFGSVTVKRWHLTRMLLLVAGSYLIAIAFGLTLGNYLFCQLTNIIIAVYDFQMITRFFANFVVVPVCVISLIAFCMVPMLQKVDGIQIWRIHDE